VSKAKPMLNPHEAMNAVTSPADAKKCLVIRAIESMPGEISEVVLGWVDKTLLDSGEPFKNHQIIKAVQLMGYHLDRTILSEHRRGVCMCYGRGGIRS
jgi:hypothetical protein